MQFKGKKMNLTLFQINSITIKEREGRGRENNLSGSLTQYFFTLYPQSNDKKCYKQTLNSTRFSHKGIA